MAQVRVFSTLELLVAVAIVAAIFCSLFVSISTVLTEGGIRDEARARETATRELWLIRIDNPDQQIWMWTDENGTEWCLFGSSNRVYHLGEIDG